METNILLKSFEIEKKLISNTEYFEWLYEFSKTYPNFEDATWYYHGSTCLTEQDKQNLDNFQYFFDAIAKYHEKNLVVANKKPYTCWYNVKYKDAYFAIGLYSRPAGTCFFKRYDYFGQMMSEPFVYFEDIMEDKVMNGFEEKKQGLNELQLLIKKLRNMRVPDSEIENAISEGYKNK